MKKGLTTIKFHGKFGKFMGREFKVKISSVKEAFRAVDSLSGRKFTKFFLEDKENLNADYRVLVNGKEMASSHSKIDTLEKATESELFMQNGNLEEGYLIPFQYTEGVLKTPKSDVELDKEYLCNQDQSHWDIMRGRQYGTVGGKRSKRRFRSKRRKHNRSFR